MEYKLIRSARRSIAVEVTADGQVIVRAPRRMPQREIDSFVNERTGWIEKTVERMKNRRVRRTVAALTPDEIAEAKARAREVLTAKAAQYAALMGVRYKGIKITSAEKRLGSCSSAGNICFSYRVMFYPEKVIDYVVIHELSHLRHMNHGRAFYADVEKYMPDYRDAIRLMKES